MIQFPLGREESESVAPMYNIPNLKSIENTNSESSVKADGFFPGYWLAFFVYIDTFCRWYLEFSQLLTPAAAPTFPTL
jgi:hypothetical protein